MLAVTKRIGMTSGRIVMMNKNNNVGNMTMKEWLLLAATLRYEILKIKGEV